MFVGSSSIVGWKTLAKDFPEVANAEPVYEPPRPGDVLHSQAAIDKISAALGYVPTHQVVEGMAETVTWFAQRLAKPTRAKTNADAASNGSGRGKTNADSEGR